MSEHFRIAVHGFGTYAILYRHMIALARSEVPSVEWAMLLPTSHHLDVVSEVIDADKLVCLELQQSRKIDELQEPVGLGDYCGNFYEDIEVEKLVFKHRRSDVQESRAFEVYRIYKDFLERFRPTHVMMAHIETFDGKVIVALANKLEIPVIAPTELRNLGGLMFSPDTGESVPVYRDATPDNVQKAKTYLGAFRKDPRPAANLDLFSVKGEEPLPTYQKPFHRRVLNFVRRTLRNPDLFEPALFKINLNYTFPGTREAIRKFRGFRNSKKFDFRAIGEVPEKFIYYPLHTTPESSINTPAPYYIDQMRAIDAIRFAMPSDYKLVVKEHWASIGIRPPAFYKALQRKAGVRIAHFSVPSLELIKRAQVTISVTGSATFEAFLLGRPSLVMGSCFFARYLGGVCSIADLRDRILAARKSPPTDESIVKALAEIYSVRYECIARPADEPGLYSNRPENIRRLLYGMLDHIERLQPFSTREREIRQ